MEGSGRRGGWGSEDMQVRGGHAGKGCGLDSKGYRGPLEDFKQTSDGI